MLEQNTPQMYSNYQKIETRRKQIFTIKVLIILAILISISIFLFVIGLSTLIVGNYALTVDNETWGFGLNHIRTLIHLARVNNEAAAIAGLVISGSLLLLFWALSMIILIVFAIILLVKWLRRIERNTK